MAGDLNRATLIGRLGADPEVSHTSGGTTVVKMRIATSETWRDKSSGERKERTQWHSVVIWNEGIGKVAQQYLSKGSKVMVEGQIETRKWQDRDGQDRYSTEIVLRSFGAQLILLGSKGDGNSGGGSPDQQSSLSSGSAPRRQNRESFDDEIPFAPEWR